MAQRMILVVGCFLTLVVNAIAAEPDGFKDYKFGMTKAEVDAIAKPRLGHYSFMGPNEKIGDITVNPSFYYEKGSDGVERLGQITFLFETNRDYATIRAAFVDRYGKPSNIQYLTFRNGLGAQFKGEVLEWKGERTVMSIMEIATGRYGSASLSTKSYEQRAQEQNSRDVKKAAKDL